MHKVSRGPMSESKKAGKESSPQDLPNSPIDDGEDIASNLSSNTTLNAVVAKRWSRRDVLRRGLAASALTTTGFATLSLTACDETAPTRSGSNLPSFSFPEVTAGVDSTHHVAAGYNADVLMRWGDKVLPNAPDFDPRNPSAAAQAEQFGYNNDFLGFFPIDGRSDHGLLVVNHEYTNDELMYPRIAQGKSRKQALRDLPEQLVRASMEAHGGSVLEVQRTGETWHVVQDSRFASRITAHTGMTITGPAAGHALLQTNADPSGRSVRGMLNNCAGGVTPWGTWLTCEENFNFYFDKDIGAEVPLPETLGRYGVPTTKAYPWGRYEARFDLSREPNEPHRFGWVVEIDPFDPTSIPVKRTALGRFKHEGAGGVVNRDNRYVIYQGDDERFEYVYKFVSKDPVDLEDLTNNRDLLDHGTLYVARFEEDGSGTWLPLVYGDPRLSAFSDQGEILIHARLASDALGATKMDRPEDIDVNPKTNRVYVMLTKNRKRKQSGVKGIDAANPRAKNTFGHIIEIIPDNEDHAAETFRWEILVRCGDPKKPDVGATFNPMTSAHGWFANPDNCVVDKYGRLWIATDGNSESRTGRSDGLWGLETDGAARGAARLFFRCPRGAELCGPCFTPDLETAFVAIQHPGESDDPKVLATFENPATRWPDFNDTVPPRPSVVAITRKGGGKIGA